MVGQCGVQKRERRRRHRKKYRDASPASRLPQPEGSPGTLRPAPAQQDKSARPCQEGIQGQYQRDDEGETTEYRHGGEGQYPPVFQITSPGANREGAFQNGMQPIAFHFENCRDVILAQSPSSPQ